MKEFPGTKNGRIIEWRDPISQAKIFEWNEDSINRCCSTTTSIYWRYGTYCFTNFSYSYYLYNMQSDVIGMVAEDMSPVVTYEYDAWGKLLSVSGEKKDTVGKLNQPVPADTNASFHPYSCPVIFAPIKDTTTFTTAPAIAEPTFNVSQNSPPTSIVITGVISGVATAATIGNLAEKMGGPLDFATKDPIFYCQNC